MVGFSIAAAQTPSNLLSPNPNQAERSVTYLPQKLQLFEFPPPNQAKQIGGGMTVVRIRNGAPEPLQIALTSTGGASVTLRVPACTDCPVYAPGQTPPPFCEGKSLEQSYTLNPGQYEARAVFMGEAWGFRSQWALAPGWEYGQCVFMTQDHRRPE